MNLGMTPEQVAERRRAGLERFIEDWVYTPKENSGLEILDMGCGRGWGLIKLQQKGWRPTGVDQDFKVQALEPLGVEIVNCDMHQLPEEWTGRFHAILSSHSLEHAKQPVKALEEWSRVTMDGAFAYVVLPYPDTRRNNPLHVGRFVIGTNVEDDGASVCNFFKANGWKPIACDYDDYREREIWLKLVKSSE